MDGPTSLVMRSGRPPVGVEEVALAGDTMADLGVAIGDRIDVTRRAAQPRSVEVVGEAIVPIVDQGDPGEGIVMSLEGFETLCADLLAAEIDRTIDLMLQFDDEDDAEAFAAELEADGAMIDPRFVPTDVRSLGDLRAGAHCRRHRRARLRARRCRPRLGARRAAAAARPRRAPCPRHASR